MRTLDDPLLIVCMISVDSLLNISMKCDDSLLVARISCADPLLIVCMISVDSLLIVGMICTD